MKSRVALAGLTLVLAAAFWRIGTSQAPSAAAWEVGAPTTGANALELVAKVDQVGEDFIFYGYLTCIHGLNDVFLFANPTVRSEATARFTVFGITQLTGRSVLETCS